MQHPCLAALQNGRTSLTHVSFTSTLAYVTLHCQKLAPDRKRLQQLPSPGVVNFDVLYTV